MFHEIDLHELAQLHAPERAFLSLYLSGPDGLKSLEHRIRKLQDLVAETEDEQEHLEQNLAMVRDFLDSYKFDPPSVCLFACWALDFKKAVPLEKPVPDLLRMDSGPYLRPLAELQDEYENFVVLTADNTDAHLYFVTSAIPSEEDRVKGGIKNRVKKGGWSQKRYSRRRDNELLHYADDIVKALAELNERERFDRIFIVGSEETLQEVRSRLTPELNEKLIETEAVDLHQQEQVWEEVFALFHEEERASEKELWQRIKGEYLRGGRAAVGAEDVLQAVAVGRVEHLLVTRDVEIRGVGCRACANVAPAQNGHCPFCASEDIFAVDLVNEMVRLASATSAPVEFADPIKGLSKVGDVAALLRY